MQVLKKFSLKKRIYILSSLILCILLGGIGIFLLNKPKEIEAGWWNETWLYRKAIEISNDNGTDLEDFQVSFVIDTATLITDGKMQSNCNDLRVTDWSGNVLPHWIEENNPGCNNANTKVWVKVPNVYKGTNATTILVYYGNAGASNIENGNLVFEFFDDFNGTGINEEKWVYSGTVTQASGTLELSPGRLQNKQNLGDSFRAESRSRVPSTPYTVSGHIALGIMDTYQTDGYGFWPFYRYDGLWQPYWRGPSSWSGLTASGSWTTGQWYRHTVSRNQGSFVWDIDGTNLYSGTHPSSASLSNESYLAAPRVWTEYVPNGSGPIGFDWIAVRRYSDFDPTTSTSATEEVTPAPIAYWKLDEGTGVVAHDASGQGLHGSVVGTPTWQAETSCVSGSCMQFNASEYINLGNPQTLQITGSQTISMWIKPANFSARRNPYAKAYGGEGTITQETSGVLNYYYGTAGGNTTPYQSIGSSQSLTLNEWNYVTLVRDLENMKLYWYINGVKTNEANANYSSATASGLTAYIGNGYTSRYDGLIDEVKIYPYARTPEQIKSDYVAGSSTTGSKVVMGSKTETSTTTPLSGKLLALYKFDEGSGESAYDAVNSQTGSVNGATWKAEGRYGKALNFAKNSESLLLDYMTWQDGQTGGVGSFGSNGTASENYRVVDTDPWGRKSVVWEARPDDVSGADGGWGHNIATIDNTKTYRFSVWVNRKVTGNGSFYLGTNGYGSVNGVYYRSDGTTNTTNPYFWVGTPSQDTWTLVVGHVWPAGSGAGSNHPDSGRYTIADGYIGAISRDYVWREETTSGRHRSYLYYSTNTDTRQQWIYPRVDIVDGTEPSIEELLNGYGAYGDDVFAEVAGTKESFSLWYDKDANGGWEHLVKSGASYYVNGVLGTPAEFPLYNSVNEVYVGRTSYSDYVTGVIDDVKIYNTTLTPEEVLLDYNQGTTATLSKSPPSIGNIWGGSASSEYCIPGDTSTCNPPVGEWLFDDNQGSTAKDTSGNNNNGTLVNSPSWSKGKEGSALSFDGVNQMVNTGQDSSLDLTSQGTISFWAKTERDYPSDTTSTRYRGLICKTTGGGTGQQSYYIDWTGTDTTRTLRARIGNSTGSYGIASSDFDFGDSWNFISFTFDGSSFSLYRNGRLISTASQSISAQTLAQDTHIGRCFNGTNYTWDGLIDQVRIYDYARTPAQIMWDYNRGAPIGHWRLDECQGTTAHDVSGNNNHGTINIGSTLPQTSVGTCTSGNTAHAWYNGRNGKLNASLNFDGVDDYVKIPYISPFNLQTLTISSWVKFSDDSASFIFEKGNVNTQYSLFSHGSDIVFRTKPVGDSYDTLSTSKTNAGIENGKWHHIVATFDSTTKRLYVDTKQILERYWPYTIEINNNDVSIGRFGGVSSGYFFTGLIDDVRIYNYPLTEEQIKLLYNDNAAVKF